LFANPTSYAGITICKRKKIIKRNTIAGWIHLRQIISIFPCIATRNLYIE